MMNITEAVARIQPGDWVSVLLEGEVTAGKDDTLWLNREGAADEAVLLRWGDGSRVAALVEVVGHRRLGTELVEAEGRFWANHGDDLYLPIWPLQTGIPEAPRRFEDLQSPRPAELRVKS